MHNLVFFLIGGLLIGALAFGAISNSQKKSTNSASNQTYVDATEVDSPDYSAENRSLQLKTFDPGAVSVTGGSCTPGGKIAYNFLLDTSSSMTSANDGRFPDMKKDVVAFISKLQPDSVVSVQAFDNRAREVVAPTFFKDIDSKYSGKINNLKPTDSTAGTNTSAGLAGAKKVIDANKSKFPGYNWSLVLVTDGCPNSVDGPTGLNIANQVRDSGISLVGYGIKLGTAGKCGNLAKRLGLPQGTKPIEAAKVLMEKITGGRSNYSLTEDETLPSFLSKVSTKTCPISAPTASKACVPTSRPAMNLLLDTSGSMQGFIPDLRNAVKNFAKGLSSDDVVGVQIYSDSDTSVNPQPTKELIPINKYSQNQSNFESRINSILDDDEGSTHMKDGFDLAQDKIDSYNLSNSVKKWALIFLSDGKPDVKGGGSYDPEQEPFAIADELKGDNVDIYTIAFTTKSDKGLMEKVASSKDKYFSVDSPDRLNQTFQDILKLLSCESS